MRKPQDFFSILLVSGICVAIIPLVVLFSRRPLQAATSGELIEAGFERQNRSEVITRSKNNMGWESLKDTMLESGISGTDTDKIIAVAQAKMSVPHQFATAPLWPVLAKRGQVGQEKVWLIEAAAPCQPMSYCFSGTSAQARKRILDRAPEVCAHRVIVVQAQAPYAVLEQQDTEQ
jgi:hypothetical protein